MPSPLDLPLLGNSNYNSSPRSTGDDLPLADTPRVPGDPTFAPEDYTSLLYNLSSWSYRVSRQEYVQYQQRRLTSLRRSLGTDSIVGNDIIQKQDTGSVRTALHSHGFEEPHTPRGSKRQNSGLQIIHSIRHQEISAARRLHALRSLPEGLRQRLPQYRGPSFLGLPMLPATHKFMLGWAIFMLVVDLSYTALFLPLLEAFESNRPGKPLFWFSIVMGFLFIMDMLVVLHRAVVVKYLDKYMYVDNPSDVARLYIRHGQFWSDAVVCMSAPLQLLGLLLPAMHTPGQGRTHTMSVLINTLILLRGLRLIKLLLLQRELFLGKFGISQLSRRRTWYIISLCYILAVMFNWLACIMLFIARHQNQKLCWLASVKGQNLTKASHLRQYVAALYWIVITTATVGYGDVSAGTPVEQLAIIGAVLVGLSFVAYSVKTLMDVMVEAALQDENAQRVSVLRDRAQMLKLWGTWQDLPSSLMDKINSYNAGPWLTHTVLKRSWEGVLQDLPPDLKGEMLMVMLVDRHRELSPLTSRLLAGLPRASAHALLALLEPRPYAPGQMLAWAGEPAHEVWLLQEGELVELVGVLPCGPLVDTSGLVAGHNMLAWLHQQGVGAGALPQAMQQQQAAADGPAEYMPQQGALGEQQEQEQQQEQRPQEEGGSFQEGQPSGGIVDGSSSSSSWRPTRAPAAAGTEAGSLGAALGSFMQQRQQPAAGAHGKPLSPIHSGRRLQPPSTPGIPAAPVGASAQAGWSTGYSPPLAGGLQQQGAGCYSRSLQSTTTSFLWAIPLNRLGLALSCMPQLGVNLLRETERQAQQRAAQQGGRSSLDDQQQQQWQPPGRA